MSSSNSTGESPRSTLLSRAAASATRRQERRDAQAQARIDTPERMRMLAETVIEHNNLVCDSGALKGARSTGLQVFAIEPTQNVVSAVHDLEQRVFQAEPDHTMRNRKEVVAFAHQILKTDAKRSIDFANVATIGFADERTTPAFKRVSFTRAEASALTLSQLPGFQHVINLTNDPRALVLWIGSLLDPHCSRAQYLHWYGGGGNGKSTVFQAIEDALGPERVVHTRFEDFKSPHWGTELTGARLLYFPDSNNTHIFSSGKFKELTAEDYATVNPKNQPHQRIRLTHRTAILSNRRVAITNDVADKRRLLPIVSEPDTESNHGLKSWYADVRNNGDKILMYCYGEYAKAVASDPGIRAYIPPSESAQAAAVEERYGDVMAFIEAALVFQSAKGFCPAPNTLRTAVYNAVAEAMGKQSLSANEKRDVKEALEAAGVEAYASAKGRVFRGVRIRGAPQDPNVDLSTSSEEEGEGETRGE